MKRPPPSNLGLRPARFEFDPKKAYSPEQLAEMGAISLKWNQVEAHIDFIGSQILFAKVPMWLRFSVDRALRTKTKIDLLEECAAKAELLDEPSKKAITETFFGVKTSNAYRNAIIHHHIYDHEKGIGSYIDESKKPFQVLVTLEAVKNLYNLIVALLDEIREVDLLLRIETDAQRPGRMDSATREFVPLSMTELREKIVPERTKELLRLQKTRKGLPKLPKFPDADSIRASADVLTAELDTTKADKN
jgi:hypothetical protein